MEINRMNMKTCPGSEEMKGTEKIPYHKIPDFHICHVLTEDLNGFLLPPVSSSVQGCPPIQVLSIDVCTGL
ncbi:hypothetical protein E2C01_022673 [Portunus trituberculatus]|uniref:Uncharacterized protein n=1 Tax=Portunus trituberculatus TaxID=210409 RepID=A0A5B7E8J9_PORTR|nr:hypothetical protein [Portunus trituberculatus]